MLSTILRIALILIMACGACAAETLQQPPPSGSRTSTTDSTANLTIEGVVLLPSGEQLNEPVKITLSTINDPGIGVFTDSIGRFSFSNLAPGNYNLEASGNPSLYESGTEQVRLSRGVRVARVRIYLREKTATKVSKPGVAVSAGEVDPKAPVSAKKEFKAATQLAADGNPQGAIERYKKAIAIYPQYLIAHNDLGVQYLNLKRLAEARTEFEACIELDAKAFNPRLNQGIVLVQQKAYGEALEHLNLAASIDSSSAPVHLYLGIVAIETDDLPTAETELAKTLSIGGREYSIAHFYIAQLEMKKGDRDGAIRELKVYLESSPGGEKAAQSRALLETLKQQ